ncbi:MAG: PKD domain-containing protein [Thermoplasmatota archaeon]
MKRLIREMPRVVPAAAIGAVLIIVVALLLFVSRDTNNAPHAEGSVRPGNVVVGEVVLFDARNSSDPDGDDLNYLWTIQGGVSSSSQVFEYIFPNPGNYTVILKVRDTGGLEDHETFLVFVSS